MPIQKKSSNLLKDPRTSQWVFLFSHLFVEVLLPLTLRKVPSILRVWQSRRLSLWWELCYIVFLSSSFLDLPRYSFLIFFFHLRSFDYVRFQYSQVFISFLVSEGSDFSLIWLFYSFRHLSFSASPYYPCSFFYAKFHPYVFSVYSYSLY